MYEVEIGSQKGQTAVALQGLKPASLLTLGGHG
jgi:hypothetical protein